MNKKLPQEHSLTLTINRKKSISMICTNEAVKELIIGWLYNEGVISEISDITVMDIHDDGVKAEVELSKGWQNDVEMIRATGLGGIGLNQKSCHSFCEIGTIYHLEYICQCKQWMAQNSPKYEATGGMHSAALFNHEKMLLMYEDIGRHNTLDKLAGGCLMNRIDASDCILLTTGRISEDMVKKAGRMGVSIIATYKIPTDRAYQLARQLGITIIGHLKRTPFEIYCGEERIQ